MSEYHRINFPSILEIYITPTWKYMHLVEKFEFLRQVTMTQNTCKTVHCLIFKV